VLKSSLQNFIKVKFNKAHSARGEKGAQFLLFCWGSSKSQWKWNRKCVEI